MRTDGLRTPPADVREEHALLGRERTENFPVALRLLPPRHREALHAVYAYARTVDELGDTFAGDRAAALHELDADLDRLWAGRRPAHPVLRRLQPVVEAHALPQQPFHRLVQANLHDQVCSRYETFDQLLGYCRFSADPVGRMVLGVFDVHDPETTRQSDRVCTALQLLEHWQDVGEDRRAGRVYLPQQDLRAYDVPEADLDRGEASPALRRLMLFEIDRAAGILDEGAGIVGRLDGWARLSVAGFVAGGQATVRALRRTHGDVLGRDASPSRARTVLRLAGLLAGATARGVRR